MCDSAVDSLGFAHALRKLIKCRHRNQQRADRFKVLAAVFATAGDGTDSVKNALSTLRRVTEERFNLVAALKPEHLMQVMGVEGMTWTLLNQCHSAASSAPAPCDSRPSPRGSVKLVSGDGLPGKVPKSGARKRTASATSPSSQRPDTSPDPWALPRKRGNTAGAVKDAPLDACSKARRN